MESLGQEAEGPRTLAPRLPDLGLRGGSDLSCVSTTGNLLNLSLSFLV